LPRSRRWPKRKLRAAYQIRNKQSRTHACREAYAVVMADLKERPVWAFDSVKVEGHAVRHRGPVSSAVRSWPGEPRIDGRDTRTVRPIEIRNGRAAAHARLGAVHPR
jgi:polyribonucleotide nucleotidyltransferase